MKLLDILTSPWAIVPEKLLEIIEIYKTHLRGEKISEETIEMIEAQIKKPLKKEEQRYEVRDTVAVIPIEGPIAKRMNLFTRISGGTSIQLLERDFLEALRDPGVSSILLAIDSPGGTVDGTVDFAELVYQSRGEKPIEAWTDNMMASAAYWIGSAADKAYISNEATQVGSIGIVATHIDVSKAEEKEGIKTTEITAGKYKRIASAHAPLSDEGRKVIQDMVDDIYTTFVNNVARNRGVAVDDVLGGMADGRVFVGKKAIKANLVDGISSLNGVIDGLSRKGSPYHTRAVMGGKIFKMFGRGKEVKTHAV